VRASTANWKNPSAAAGRISERSARQKPLAPAVEAARLHPAELHGEEQDEEQAGPEGRHGDAELGQRHREVIAPSAVPRGREHPDGNRRHDHEPGGEQGQRQGHAHARQDEARHRHVVLDGPAEIAPRGPADPLEVLHGERPVEPHRRPQPGHRLGASLGAQDDHRGVPGQDPDHHEHEHRDEEEGDRERHHPPRDVPPH
jgi:hypothetical protein